MGLGAEGARTLRILRGLWRATRGGPSAVAVVQRARLSALVALAADRSPYYRRRYHGLNFDGMSPPNLRRLPVVDKRDLIEHFDEWGTEPGVRRAAVDAFVADPGQVGELLDDRYAVWTTSGTTGRPGIFVHDPTAVAVYQALVARLYVSVLSGQLVWRRLRGGRRTAAVFVTGGHFAGAAGLQRAQRRYPRLAAGGRLLSALDPLPVIIDELNSFQPSLLAGYPSVLELLAAEQLDGRLRLRPPALVLAGGEHLSPTARERITAAFDAPVRDTYGASEFPGVAYECRHGWLHAHADWAILEPVTADGRPVPPGELSDTVLLTNLANRAQPLIRYDLGDRVMFAPEACSCGSPLPALRIEGRTNDTIVLQADGREVRLLPLALVTVVEDAPGVRRCQLVQSGPGSLRLRLDISPTADAEQVWGEALRRLRGFVAAQGLPGADIRRADEPTRVEPRSGKLRQVLREPSRSPEGAPG